MMDIDYITRANIQSLILKYNLLSQVSQETVFSKGYKIQSKDLFSSEIKDKNREIVNIFEFLLKKRFQENSLTIKL